MVKYVKAAVPPAEVVAKPDLAPLEKELANALRTRGGMGTLRAARAAELVAELVAKYVKAAVPPPAPAAEGPEKPAGGPPGSTG